MTPNHPDQENAQPELRGSKHAATLAWLISLSLHGIGIIAALLISFLDPPASISTVEVTILKNSPLVTYEPATQPSTSQSVGRIRQLPVSSAETVADPLTTPSLVIEKPLEVEAEENISTFTIPQDRFEKKKWTAEEAYGELARLLQEYPQYKDMVLREMVAGSGFAADTVGRIDLFLDQMLAGTHAPSWVKQRHVVERAFSTYDGVHGWKQNSNYGGGINILGILDFLIGLITSDE